MRARLHVRGGRAGFFREGTHALCEVRSTRQLLEATCDAVESLTGQLRAIGQDLVHEIEIAENTDGSERVLHLGLASGADARPLHTLRLTDGASGLVSGEAPAFATGTVIAGSPFVTDTIKAGSGVMSLRRHVLAFFQANRYLLPDLVSHVVDAIVPGTRVVDLYAGVGLFSAAAAVARRATVVAVEGDPVASSDLAVNVRDLGGIEAVHQSVETFTARTRVPADLLLVDPPRTGMSKEALNGVLRMGAPRVLYVSCDTPTFARDARRLLDAGYAIERMEGFDLFPNTPHVETVALFERR
jgi:23S rRNA (uracil1939-C5)-methyltransferase